MDKIDRPRTDVFGNGVWPYKTFEGSPTELAVVCPNCSYPVVKDYDEQGKMIGFREESGPLDEDQALEEGWLDHGLGLYCPKCSLLELERMAKEKAEGAESLVSGDMGEVVDASIIQGLVPSVSEGTLVQVVRMFRAERLNRFRVLAGMEMIKIPEPVPENDTQAQEFLIVIN